MGRFWEGVVVNAELNNIQQHIQPVPGWSRSGTLPRASPRGYAYSSLSGLQFNWHLDCGKIEGLSPQHLYFGIHSQAAAQPPTRDYRLSTKVHNSPSSASHASLFERPVSLVPVLLHFRQSPVFPVPAQNSALHLFLLPCLFRLHL